MTIDDDKWEIQFYEVEELSKNLKMLMRDYTRYDIEVDEEEIFEKKFQVEKDRMQKIQEKIDTGEIGQLTHPHENFNVFPDTPEKIIQQSEKEKEFSRKTEESLNERAKEISRDIILKSQKELIESIIDNAEALSTNDINNISSSLLPKVTISSMTAEERIQENVRKDNAKFLKRSSVKLKITPPKKNNREKPYEKDKDKEDN